MQNTSSKLIQTLTASMNLVSQTNDPNEINDIIEKLLLDFSESDHATLFLFDPVAQTLYSKNHEKTLSMIEPQGIIGEAFLKKEAAFYNHLASEKNYVASIDNPDGLKLKSQIVLPIIENEELLGIVRTSRSIRHHQPYQQKDLELLKSLETFLIKIIHIILSDTQKNIPIDISEINENIEEATKEEHPVDMDSMMLFLSNIVHDIRTPANSLYGFLELIEERIEDKRLKEFIENAKESAKFINTLTDSILEQTKSRQESKNSTPKIIPTIKFFAHIANTFSADMYNKEIDYLIYLDPLLPKEIKVDELKLKRILINLLGNAYKFTPKGKRIDFKVKFDKETSKIKISVSDQGIGIDPSRQKEIFKAFEQAEEETSLQYGGTGLGLSISAQYVNDLEGKLKLKSALDKGSKFYFSIPVEITNPLPSHEPFKNLNKKITILTDCSECIHPKNIVTYLTELGMPETHIDISDTLSTDTTHLFCFQHKLSSDIIETAKKQHIELLVVEESLFSLKTDESEEAYSIISENTYYGDTVHSTVFSEKKKKILIADDNKINIMLLKSMLETEFVETHSTADGRETLDLLKEAYESGMPFDIIFIDKHMPSISGSKVIEEYRAYEKSKNASPAFVISITGDPNLSNEEKALYDFFVTKPFNTESVRSAIKNIPS